MSAMPQASAPVNAITLESIIEHLAREGIDNPLIWQHLDRTDRPKIALLLTQLDSVDAEAFDPVLNASLKKRQFESDKSARKGKLFEDITVELLSGLTCFGVRSNVTTDVNQLDLLVQLEPNSSIVPAFRSWGSHIICECKFHETGVGVDWVEKLHSILRTHRAKVGVLISKKGIAKTGRGRAIIHLLHLLAVDNHHIICLSREDLDHCVANGGLLQMLVDRYVAVMHGIPAFLKEKIKT